MAEQISNCVYQSDHLVLMLTENANILNQKVGPMWKCISNWLDFQKAILGYVEWSEVYTIDTHKQYKQTTSISWIKYGFP